MLKFSLQIPSQSSVLMKVRLIFLYPGRYYVRLREKFSVDSGVNHCLESLVHVMPKPLIINVQD